MQTKPFFIASALQSPITPLVVLPSVFGDLSVFQLEDGIGVEAFFAVATLNVVARNDTIFIAIPAFRAPPTD